MLDERSALLAFNLTTGIGPARVRKLMAHCGTASQAWHASPTDWQLAGLDQRSIQALREAHHSLDLEAAWEAIRRAAISVIIETDPEYPERLRSIALPPPLLYVRGTLEASDSQAVAVVGTRNPTPYGREVALQLASDIAGAGLTVVSGLALGIDANAHKAALQRSGRTLAVLGSGLATIYPPQHATLAEHIVLQGALISEYAPTSSPASGNFPARNRLISGLAAGVLVVEAGARSGALITAQFALEQGREVFAVPGSILSPASQGPNQLIIDGATPIRHIDDLLYHLQLDRRAAQAEVVSIVPESPAEALLLDQLGAEPCHIDDLGRLAGLSAADTAATLGMMELKGMVRHVGAMQYVIARQGTTRRQ